jgi:hypothetical protein
MVATGEVGLRGISGDGFRSAVVGLEGRLPESMTVGPVAVERCSKCTEPLDAQFVPVGEFVASIPAPRGDHR